jgi:hypothetical protein
MISLTYTFQTWRDAGLSPFSAPKPTFTNMSGFMNARPGPATTAICGIAPSRT